MYLMNINASLFFFPFKFRVNEIKRENVLPLTFTIVFVPSRISFLFQNTCYDHLYLTQKF